MDATRLSASRHGETEWNVDTRIQGQLDIGLNRTGLWQAGRVAQALADEPIAAIYASDLSRAWQTAQAIGSARGLAVTPEPRLRERAFGHFEGRTFTGWHRHVTLVTAAQLFLTELRSDPKAAAPA